MLCPFLNCNVELSDNRRAHIETDHGELLPDHPEFIEAVLETPQVVRNSTRMAGAFLLSRWYPHFMRGKHVVVVVKREDTRCWIVTAFVARRLSGGILIWTHLS